MSTHCIFCRHRSTPQGPHLLVQQPIYTSLLRHFPLCRTSRVRDPEMQSRSSTRGEQPHLHSNMIYKNRSCLVQPLRLSFSSTIPVVKRVEPAYRRRVKAAQGWMRDATIQKARGIIQVGISFTATRESAVTLTCAPLRRT